MKIKGDFITNSSSTNYVSFIPDNFDISKFIHILYEKHKEELEDVMMFAEIEDKDGFNAAFCNKFNELLVQGCVYEYDNVFFYLTTYILKELELIIDEWESNASQDGNIWNINSEKLKEKIAPIKTGGWGLRHGGWGHESKE